MCRRLIGLHPKSTIAHRGHPIMTQKTLFDGIDNRIALDREDGDYAYFHALMLKLEYLSKIVTSGIIACLGDDADRHRFSLEHKLVRADSMGVWVETLNTALVGAPAQSLRFDARDIARDLTEQVGSTDWRHSAVNQLNQAARVIGVESNLGVKVALRQFFDIGSQLRNRGRGHGAPTASQCGRSCADLENSLNTVVRNMAIFRLSWVYLHRNLSGKYRVSSLLNSSTAFDYLKRTRDERLSNGVYFNLSSQVDAANPVYVPLIFTDPNFLDVALPNGNYKAKTFEVLSYVTNDASRQDGSTWSAPPARLPQSETEGSTEIEPLGNTFANVPPSPAGYVPRTNLERRLLKELLKQERHPIISLTGSGGIGKTTIAINAIHTIVEQDPAPYDVILWISARDIDLLDFGPKPVSQHVFTQRDISRAAVELLEPPETSLEDFDPNVFFQECLSSGAAGSTLFVLDNFETLQNPADVVEWIDTHIRPPNKVLITTRFRDFLGDYPIEIRGMLDDEANMLVDQHAGRLGINHLLTSDYQEKAYR